MAATNDIDYNNVWNMLQAFPDFLNYVLPYITDRTVFNSIASSNKKLYELSKLIQSPWPKIYRLPDADNSNCLAVWSPDGTRVAYTYGYGHNIAIVDQRYGIIDRIDNRVSLRDLKFSPDGRFLVPADVAGVVRLWNNLTGNYEQLQEWNVGAETLGYNFRSHCSFSISTCNRYIVVVLNNHVFLKDIERGGRTIQSLTTPLDYIMKDKVMFSFDGNAVLLFVEENRNFSGIKVWRPYLDNAEDKLIILNPSNPSQTFQYVLSNDTTIVAMIYSDVHTSGGIKGVTLWSIDNDYKSLKLEADIKEDIYALQFTQDGKYIVCGLQDVLWFWSIAEKETTEIRHVSYNGNVNQNLTVRNFIRYFSPNSQRLIVFNHSESTGCCVFISHHECQKV